MAMRKKLGGWMLAVSVMLAATATAQPRRLQAGTTVTEAELATVGGVDACFATMLIPDSIWEQMQGKSYKKNPYIGRDDLRYIRVLHWDYDGKTHVGELVSNKRIADVLVSIFRELYDARYPIQRMVLPDRYNADDEAQMSDNNSSCFCYRAVAGSKTLSYHARGLAIDLNTLYNPYCKRRADGTWYVQPAMAKPYCNRSRSFRYKIDTNDLAYRLFTRNGFSWGGHWRSCKDYQHFEFRGGK